MFVFFCAQQDNECHQFNGYSNSDHLTPSPTPEYAEVPKPMVTRDARDMEPNLPTAQQHLKLFPSNA